MEKITILIITGGRRRCLEQCLSCIYETSDDSEREIIIWDNASEDDTQEFLGSLMGYPGIRAIRSDKNIPQMPFVYMLKLVKTKYTLTMDDDTWLVTKGWAKAIMERMEKDPELVAVRFPKAYDERTLLVKPSRPRFRTESIVGKFVPKEGPDFTLNEGVMSNNSTVWRTDYIRGRQLTQEGDGICRDWGNVWHPKLAGKSWGMVTKYLVMHVNQPWWYLGHQGEKYWDRRSRWRPNQPGCPPEVHLKRMTDAKQRSGWGIPIEKCTDIEELKSIEELK